VTSVFVCSPARRQTAATLAQPLRGTSAASMSAAAMSETSSTSSVPIGVR
jgi:hypothetical protein